MTLKQAQKLLELLEATESDPQALLEWCGVNTANYDPDYLLQHLSEIPLERYRHAIKMLEIKERRAK